MLADGDWGDSLHSRAARGPHDSRVMSADESFEFIAVTLVMGVSGLQAFMEFIEFIEFMDFMGFSMFMARALAAGAQRRRCRRAPPGDARGAGPGRLGSRGTGVEWSSTGGRGHGDRGTRPCPIE